MTRPASVEVSAGPDPAHHTLALDESSTRWLASLRAHGTQRDEAVAELHALLLRAARFETTRRAAGLSARDRDDQAMQAADDALMHVLDKQETFEGRSRSPPRRTSSGSTKPASRPADATGRTGKSRSRPSPGHSSRTPAPSRRPSSKSAR